jgi:class 3 adenylate cyclase
MPSAGSTMRLVLFLLVALLLPSRALAVTAAPVDPATRHLALGPYLEVLEDETASLGIDDVRRPDVASRFHPSRGSFGPNLGFTTAVAWVRFTVENRSEVPIERWVVVDFPPVEHVELFREGEPPAIQGSLHAFSARQLARPSYSFHLALAPGEKTVVHLRSWGEAEVQLPMALWELRALVESDRTFTALSSLAFGVMLALALYNAFLFFFVRERSHLYYAAQVVWVVVWIMCIDGSLGYLLRDRVEHIPHEVNVLGAYVGALFSAAFVRRVLRTREKPWLDRLFLWLAVLMAITGSLTLLGLLDYRANNKIGPVLVLLAMLTGIATALMRWREGATAAPWMALAWSSFMGVIVLMLLSVWGIVSVRVGLLPHLAWTSETILFSLALAADARQRNEKLALMHRASMRFVPHELLALLGRRELPDVRQGDQVERELTTFFFDVRSFTSLAESMTPEQTIAFVNAIFSRMEAPITRFHGVIDKFMGDGVMALFAGADDAVAAAVACLAALDRYNEERARNGEPRVSIGIGLHTGRLMVGTVGGAGRLSCTVIGDNVNLASRIEGMTKTFGASILISEATRDALARPADVAMRRLGLVAAKGKTRAVGIYEVLDGLPADERARKLKTRDRLDAALSSFVAGDLVAARGGFDGCVREDESDVAAALYVKLAARLGEAPSSGTPWDGSVQLDAK